MSQDELKVNLRLLERGDFSLLVDWINTPHVARWWDGLTDIDAITARYEPRLSEQSPTRVYIAECKNIPIGFIQCYRHTDYPDWDKIVGIKNAAGIDYLIGENSFIGQGIGGKIIEQIAQIAFELYPDIEVIVSTPQKHNIASCRALEKAGFKLLEVRLLESDDPSDAGIACIYVLRRTNVYRPSN